MDLITGGLYQGQDNFIKENYKSSLELYSFVRSELVKGLDEDAIASLVLSKEVEAVNALEIGAGMIPVETFERDLREVYGRIVCRLSKEANKVIRMICGIAVVIK